MIGADHYLYWQRRGWKNYLCSSNCLTMCKDWKKDNLPYYAYNAGLSVMCLTIDAEHQGLRVHQMAGWDEKKVKKALGFPKNYRIIVVFALGYEWQAKKSLG